MNRGSRPIRGVRAIGLLLALLLSCGLMVTACSSDDSSPTEGLALPTVVNAPGAWSREEHREGPVAALGFAMRKTPVGLFDRREALALFATSALDGRSWWLNLPGMASDRSAFFGRVALSPDGRWIGWDRTDNQRVLHGWSVLDTTTGRIQQFNVSGSRRLRPTETELTFSGDSKYLVTTHRDFQKPPHGRRNVHLLAWSLADGTSTALENPSMHEGPSLGSSGLGVVWSRGPQIFRMDPQTGARSQVTLPRDVYLSSWAPNDAAFAYIGADDSGERLYVGASASTANRAVKLPETSPIGEALAWRDSTHVVVGNYRRDVYVVDITDGSYQSVEMAGTGEILNTPILANDLWSKPLRVPDPPSGSTDPRKLWHWCGLLLFVVLLVVGASILRRSNSVADKRFVPTAVKLPTIAWVLGWLFLIQQVVLLVGRGTKSGDPLGILLSIAVSAFVARWLADGVLRARMVRLCLVWIGLSAAVALTFMGIGADIGGRANAVIFTFSAAQILALALFCTTDFFHDRRRRPAVPGAVVAPLLLIAALTGLLAGLTNSAGPDGSSTYISIRL